MARREVVKSHVTITGLAFARDRKTLRINTIAESIADTLELFLEDPHHPQLRNQELREKFAGLRSIDVTGDWRAVFKETHSGKQKFIKFYVIGTHKQLYG